MSAFVSAGDPRVRDNGDGTYAVPGGHNSWTVRPVDGRWEGTADHGEYSTGVTGETADDVLRQLIGEPLTAAEYYAGAGLTDVQRHLMDEVTNRAGIDGSDTQVHLDAADATNADKAAVAEVLGEPGEGDRYTNPGSYAQRRADEIAEKIEQALPELEAETADPAGTLEARGWPTDGAEDFGARKRASVIAARDYAASLRERAAAGQPMTLSDIAEAEKVAHAAQMGGILIDSRRLTESQRYWSDEERQAAIAHEDAKRAAIEGSGAFTHVAEDGQVPFWQLGSVDQAEDKSHAGRDEATADQQEEQMSNHTTRVYTEPVNAPGAHFGIGNVTRSTSSRHVGTESESTTPSPRGSVSNTFNGLVIADNARFDEGDVTNTFGPSSDDCAEA